MTREHVTPTDTGAQDRSKEQDIDTLYETPHFQETPMAAHIENAGSIMMEVGEKEADTGQDGCYWKPTADHLKYEGSTGGRRNIPEFERLNETVDDEELEGNFTLETEERIKGEQAEKRRHREKAHAAARADVTERRVERCREAVEADTMYQRTTSDESPTAPKVNPEDPRAQMDASTLGDVNEAAMRLAEEFDDERTVGQAVISRQVARRVANGDSVLDAMLKVKESLQSNEGVKQKLADIDPYAQHEATVEVEVEQLWDPKSHSQRQVGLVSDDSGERVKFTVWQAAGDKPLVYEGDTIRVERAKVNIYQQEATLAVAGDTEIHILEEGERGELPERHAVEEGGHEEPAWSAESEQHAWVSTVMSDDEQTVVECADCGTKAEAVGSVCPECESPIVGAVADGDGDTLEAPGGGVVHSPAAIRENKDGRKRTRYVALPTECPVDGCSHSGFSTFAELRGHFGANADGAHQAFDLSLEDYTKGEKAEDDDAPTLGNLPESGTFTVAQKAEGTRSLPSEDEYQDMMDGAETVLNFSRTAHCENCEEEVNVSVEVKQLRAADESGTRVFHGECGCTWREDD